MLMSKPPPFAAQAASGELPLLKAGAGAAVLSLPTRGATAVAASFPGGNSTKIVATTVQHISDVMALALLVNSRQHPRMQWEQQQFPFLLLLLLHPTNLFFPLPPQCSSIVVFVA